MSKKTAENELMAVNGIKAVIEEIERFDGLNYRSMFGGTGYFIDDAMFLLIEKDQAYLRGGVDLTDDLIALHCSQFKYKKRIGCARIQYYNITELYDNDRGRAQLLMFRSIDIAKSDKLKCACHDRLRDLPNLQLSIERMLARVGILDVTRLKHLGSTECFRKLQSIYGLDLNVNLLWKLEGAIQGIHFTLLQHSIKNELLIKVLSKEVIPKETLSSKSLKKGPDGTSDYR
ncbi:hypothetical protein A9264_02875 [Vibrio sp. UCD-FRSSP16_10]|uniref:TfoX/Sxy family DNA transformation protein n=1 Tax=unclassified Vibrio TaxID=2614977 RepID=UPI0007FED69D|nr:MULTISPECIES: TfoX/Sxy family DNA transformation protein [unclassified Vibrio]OBT12099.1 hypothetical protein A9260_04325 [Vibrio sp. UCD-FRSSP16_30]OBT20430.1 hypothetical protein A9264_02875 [Vibrio sp. UCD-FRSSP16_10]